MTLLPAVLVAAVVTGPQVKPAAVYSSAVDKYVARDFQGAASLLAGLPERDIQREVEIATTLTGSSAGATGRAEAAAMLHTEYAMLDGLDDRVVQFHIDMAHLLLKFDRTRVQRLRPAAGFNSADEVADQQRTRDFLPRWYALSTAVLLLRGTDRAARILMDEASKLMPEDRTVLLQVALLTEFEAVWSPPAPLDPNPQLARSMHDADSTAFDLSYEQRRWGPAEAAFRRVLVADPDNYEAHLHFGVVLLTLRKVPEAQAELESARDRGVDPFVIYLANLFLGRLLERQGDLVAAAGEYERALATAPSCQSAYMALSLLEQRRGNPQRARELIDRFASIPARDRVDDPWWGYHTARIPVDALQWLRTRVRQ